MKKLLLIGLCMLLLIPFSLAVTDNDLEPYLVAQWGMEDGSGTTITDSSDNNNDLTIKNCDNNGWNNGIIGGGWKSNGDSDCMATGNSTDYSNLGAIELWVNLTTTGSNQVLFANTNVTENNVHTEAKTVSPNLRLDDTGNGNYLVSAHQPTANAWLHYVVTRNATHHTVYINGTYDSSIAETNAFSLDNHNQFTLGALNYFDGGVPSIIQESVIVYDLVRLYNKNLTNEEVNFTFNEGVGRVISAVGTIDLTNFEITSGNLQGTNTTAWDQNASINVTTDVLTGTFTTNVDANCSMRLNISQNYTEMIAADSNYKLATTETTSHSFTLYDTINLGNQKVHISCVDTNGAGRAAGVSDSGALELNMVSPSGVSVTLQFPLDNNRTIEDNVGFTYKPITYSSDFSNCSLLINGTLNSTVNSTLITNNSDSFISVNTLEYYNYTWNIKCCDVGGTCANGTARNIERNNFSIDNCSKYSTVAYNFTLKNESNSVVLNGDIDGIFNYTYGSVRRSYTLDMDSTEFSSICIHPSYASLGGSYTIDYSASGYPQRSNDLGSALYNNITEQVNLFLLATDAGIYARFITVDSFSNPISDVTAKMKKDGVTQETQTSDDSGLVTFWVNPDQDYSFEFTKTGYSAVTYSLRPTTSEIYTISMATTTGSRNRSYGSGISYSFTPSPRILQNNTAYDFRFQMDSTHWTVTDCTLFIVNNVTILSSSSSSYDSDSCDITINYNTGSYDSIKLIGQYGLNNTYINQSFPYSVFHTYTGQFSLKNFLDDLKAFNGAGFNNNTKLILSLLIIMGVVVSISIRKDGLRDPTILIGIIIVLTWLFSIMGWLSITTGGVPTIMQQWIIAILVTLLGGSYIVRDML